MNMNLIDFLLQKQVIQPADVSVIEKAVAGGVSLEKALQDVGISEEKIIEAKGEMIGLPIRKVTDLKLSKEAISYVPEESAMHYKLAPLGITDGVLEVGIVDPDNLEARDALNFISSRSGMPYKLFLVSNEDFEKVLEVYSGLGSEVTEALSQLETELDEDKEEDGRPTEKEQKKELAELERSVNKEESTDTRIIEDAPVTKIVATILRYATEGGASDIHLEHTKDSVRVRFRVDGVLMTSLVLPQKVQSAVIARIKILANMRLDEKRKPQDGRFSAKIDGSKIDFRVSTFPTYYGEKVVMRILDQDKGVKNLEGLGLSEENIAMLREALKRPYGLILVSGPTGSGKSTTLYAMLQEIDREKFNVLSLEDPVEYNIEGVNQSQVRPEIGYTFANGLRTTLRQDPDIIMVGEIRDAETAKLAIQAALTGHLVLSTIHTNNAIGVIPRLLDMGIDSYLIAPTLILTMAQRLVARMCGSGEERVVDESLQIMIDKQFADLPEEYRAKLPLTKTVYDKKASPECPEGVSGRIAVTEILNMTKEIEATTLKNPTEQEIYKVARQQGMLTMKEDALLKAMQGKIPFGEVNTL